MPNQNERPSLTTDLLTRYETQKEGGAYDAKTAATSTAPNSLQSAQFEKTDKFLVKEPIGVSQFKNDGKDLSQFVKGLDTRKYKG
jgi:hypothetical protein